MMGYGKMGRIEKKKVNGQTYTGIKPLQVEIPPPKTLYHIGRMATHIFH